MNPYEWLECSYLKETNINTLNALGKLKVTNAFINNEIKE